MARILIVEDDNTFRSLLRNIIVGEGHEAQEAISAEQGLAMLQRENFDLVLTDLKLPAMSGLELYRASRNDPAAPPFILLTAFGTIEEAVTAMKEGVLDFLTKPLKDPATLRAVIHKALAANRREREYLALKATEAAGIPSDQLIFAGAAMAEVQHLVQEVAQTATTVLISGESGSGKELVARAIHLYSPRRSEGFVTINCAAIPENLLESELFGHEKGAFTGALQARRGKFELAQGGTLFLDEIGELPLSLQAKLLRVLQERRFERVGGSREIIVDVRIVAATNRDLQLEIREKRFREDLYYRLNVFPVHLPPLRERIDALPLLLDYLIERFARLTGRKVTGIDPDAEALLRSYSWPGNIRELQNVIERAVILCKGSITRQNLPESLGQELPGEKLSGSLLASLEQQAIMEALRECDNNRRLAAEKLGISRRTLQYRLKRYGMAKED